MPYECGYQMKTLFDNDIPDSGVALLGGLMILNFLVLLLLTTWQISLLVISLSINAIILIFKEEAFVPLVGVMILEFLISLGLL